MLALVSRNYNNAKDKTEIMLKNFSIERIQRIHVKNLNKFEKHISNTLSLTCK